MIEIEIISCHLTGRSFHQRRCMYLKSVPERRSGGAAPGIALRVGEAVRQVKWWQRQLPVVPSSRRRFFLTIPAGAAGA
jgi:hypothetical protein